MHARSTRPQTNQRWCVQDIAFFFIQIQVQILNLHCSNKFSNTAAAAAFFFFSSTYYFSILSSINFFSFKRLHAILPLCLLYLGDVGPNTGGMGAYAPAPLLNASLRHQCIGIVQATVTAMAEEGCPYQGVLYAGTFQQHAKYNR